MVFLILNRAGGDVRVNRCAAAVVYKMEIC